MGSITSTRPAYICPYWAAAFCAFIRFIRPTGRVLGPLGSVSSVMAMMYSFQKDRKLKRITVTMLGFAMGKITFTMVRV